MGLRERMIVAALRGEHLDDLQRQFVDPETGDDGWVSLSCRRLEDPNVELDGGVVIMRDITARKVMADALRVAKERMEEELNVGREIQMGMLPTVFPSVPELEVFATLEPAREVGGDR